jgi:hypothetical protein
VRRQLAGRLGLRRMPEIEFRFDESIEQHARIEQLIHEIHEQDAARGADVAADAADATGSEEAVDAEAPAGDEGPREP